MCWCPRGTTKHLEYEAATLLLWVHCLERLNWPSARELRPSLTIMINLRKPGTIFTVVAHVPVPEIHMVFFDFVQNHFTQKVRRDFYGGIRLRGVGDRLSHNLAHDSSGQYLTPSGPLTMIDSNEIFNTGYSEGKC